MNEPLDLPTPNLPLLRKVLDHIDAHPAEWNQISYATEGVCGTAFCIAGHALVMSGYDCHGRLFYDADGKEVDAELTALDVLGLTPGEGDCVGGLFHYDNTRERVQAVAESIAERAGERL